MAKINLEYFNGTEWIHVDGFKTNELAWITLGADNRDYRTVDSKGRVIEEARVNSTKINKDISELVHDLGSSGRSVIATECVSQQIRLSDGRPAQIKIRIEADPREFEDVAP